MGDRALPDPNLHFAALWRFCCGRSTRRPHHTSLFHNQLLLMAGPFVVFFVVVHFRVPTHVTKHILFSSAASSSAVGHLPQGSSEGKAATAGDEIDRSRGNPGRAGCIRSWHPAFFPFRLLLGSIASIDQFVDPPTGTSAAQLRGSPRANETKATSFGMIIPKGQILACRCLLFRLKDPLGMERNAINASAASCDTSRS
ncbi:hypothetical protein DFJ73DRAFT_502225 [Zopfochytrium polystomum]|nr:hypothetical protein DFJ73DRAFT_502225 [Zopfochytrium polystomum]